MGGNLSSVEVVDTSADIISLSDYNADILLLVFAAGSFYAMGMILGTLRLIDHWRGPRGENEVERSKVLLAIFLSVAWPLILIYVWNQER
ncbi:hypothetical protein K3495_g6189 [Podosphaera aphanis]|nr:hypothetical protein K3495_g6189 [Podosphaera aphanis]